MRPPDHAHPRRTEAGFWRDLRAQFREDAEWIRRLRFETREEAIARSTSTEPAFGPVDEEDNTPWAPAEGRNEAFIKHPSLFCYRRTDDTEFLRECYRHAHRAIDELDTLFARQIGTPEFLSRWGAFQFAVGFLMNTYLSSRTDDLGPERAGKAGGEKKSRLANDSVARARRRYVAHLVNRLRDRGLKRKQIDFQVAKFIHDLLERDNLPHGFDRAWFEGILEIHDGHPQLKTTFDANHLSMAKIEALAKEPSTDIPPINI